MTIPARTHHIFAPQVIGQFISCLPAQAGEPVYFINTSTISRIEVKGSDVIATTDDDQPHVAGREHPRGDVKRLLFEILGEIEVNGAPGKEKENG